MVDYQKGKIYQINTTLGPEVYYGSTKSTLKQRMAQHKNPHFFLGTAHLIFKKYGFENCKIELVEDYPCNSRKELETRERFYIENNVCVNVQIPTRTNVEYRVDNKEKIKTRGKQYYINNVEKIKAQSKQYRIDNIEKRREWESTQITCICGAIISKANKARHEQTQKHIKSMK